MSTKSTPGRRARMASTGRFVKPGEPMPQEQLDAIQGRVDAAARGPWEHDFCGNVDQVENQSHAISVRIADNLTPGDAALIAHAPTDLADLLAEVERLRALTTVDEEGQ